MADTWAVRPKKKTFSVGEELSDEDLDAMEGKAPAAPAPPMSSSTPAIGEERSDEELDALESGAAPDPSVKHFTSKMDPTKKMLAQYTGALNLGGFNFGDEAASAAAYGMDHAGHFLGVLDGKPKSYRDYLRMSNDNTHEYNDRRNTTDDDPGKIQWDETGNLASTGLGTVIGAAPFGVAFKGGNLLAQGANRLAATAAPKLAIPIMEQGVNAAARIAPKWFETLAGWALGGAAAHKATELGSVELTPEQQQMADASDAQQRVPGAQLAASTPSIPTGALGLDAVSHTPLLNTMVEGGAEGIGGGMFGHTLGNTARVAGEFIPGPMKAAARTLARNIFEAGHTPEQINQFHAENLKLDPKATLDMAGPQGSEYMQRVAATAARGGGGPLEEFNNLVKPRQAMHSRDVAAASDAALGSKGGSHKVMLEQLSDQQSELAGPAYKAANAVEQKFSPVLTEIVNRPSIKPIFDQALQRAIDSGRPESDFITRDQNGTVVKFGTELLNIIKKRLDAHASMSYMAGDGDTGGYFKQMKNSLVAEADRLNPLYKEARKLWAGQEEMQEALQQGHASFGKGGDYVTHYMKQYADNPSLLESFLTGFAQNGATAARTTAEEGNAVIKLLGNADRQDAYRAALGDEKYEQFLKYMDLKSKGYRSFFEGKKQSATDLRQNETAAMKADSTAELAEQAMQAASNPLAFIHEKGIGRFNRIFHSFDTAKRGYIVKWLLSNDPKLQKQAMEEIAKQFGWAKATAQAGERGEGIGGSLITTAGRPLSAELLGQGQGK